MLTGLKLPSLCFVLVGSPTLFCWLFPLGVSQVSTLCLFEEYCGRSYRLILAVSFFLGQYIVPHTLLRTIHKA